MGGGRGGIRGLGLVILERWKQFEADCLRYYGVEAGRLDARLGLVCLKGLPSDASVWGPHTVDWEWQLQVLEALDGVRRQVAALTGDKKARRMKPLRFPRGESWPAKSEKKQKRSWAQALKEIAHNLSGR